MSSGNSMNGLLACRVCGKAIAHLAQTCPSCGAPNNWMHPDVAHFLSVKDATGISGKFNFTNTKTTVTGQSAAFAPLWAWGIALIFCVIGSFFMLFLGFLALVPAVFISFLILILTTRTDNFHADVVNRQWTSSNERFWKPVRTALKL